MRKCGCGTWSLARARQVRAATNGLVGRPACCRCTVLVAATPTCSAQPPPPSARRLIAHCQVLPHPLAVLRGHFSAITSSPASRRSFFTCFPTHNGRLLPAVLKGDYSAVNQAACPILSSPFPLIQVQCSRATFPAVTSSLSQSPTLSYLPPHQNGWLLPAVLKGHYSAVPPKPLAQYLVLPFFSFNCSAQGPLFSGHLPQPVSRRLDAAERRAGQRGGGLEHAGPLQAVDCACL